MKEERSLDTQLGRLLEVVDAIYRDEEGCVKYHYLLVDLEAKYLGGELKAGSDIEDARWVTQEELDEFHPYDKLKSVILKALEGDE